jgi:hypothetical protein
LGIFIFVAIVAVVAWLIYAGVKRQNAQSGTTPAVTSIADIPLPHWENQASSTPIESSPLYVNLQQTFHGERDNIVQTINDVADMLEGEVDVRTFPNEPTANAMRVDHEAYRNLVSQQSNRLAMMFQDAEVSFEQASSSSGTPEMLRQAYAAFLDQLLAAARMFASTESPQTYAQTQARYREFLKELYNQIAKWPKALRDASKDVTGNVCEVVLSVDYDMSPLQRAIQIESA